MPSIAKLLDGDLFSGGDVGVWTLKRIYNLQVDAYSLEQFQDPEGWQIITQSYGLDEAVIRFTKAEKLIDSMECPKNRYGALCCYGILVYI